MTVLPPRRCDAGLRARVDAPGAPSSVDGLAAGLADGDRAARRP